MVIGGLHIGRAVKNAGDFRGLCLVRLKVVQCGSEGGGGKKYSKKNERGEQEEEKAKERRKG